MCRGTAPILRHRFRLVHHQRLCGIQLPRSCSTTQTVPTRLQLLRVNGAEHHYHTMLMLNGERAVDHRDTLEVSHETKVRLCVAAHAQAPCLVDATVVAQKSADVTLTVACPIPTQRSRATGENAAHEGSAAETDDLELVGDPDLLETAVV